MTAIIGLWHLVFFASQYETPRPANVDAGAAQHLKDSSLVRLILQVVRHIRRFDRCHEMAR